jgi:hypothetical protein
MEGECKRGEVLLEEIANPLDLFGVSNLSETGVTAGWVLFIPSLSGDSTFIQAIQCSILITDCRISLFFFAFHNNESC